MSKHTPGPWHVHSAVGSCGNELYLDIKPSGDYRGQIVSVFDAENIEGITLGERNANARLIAAAPDLLQGAKDARALLSHAGCPVDWLDALITKAEGA